MRKKCGVCFGKGQVDNPKYYGQMMGYCGPNGERCPQMNCPNCQGQGWVGIPDNTIINNEPPQNPDNENNGAEGD